MATKQFNDAFWKWFGNSVVRNEDGSPRIVYHGTDAVEFTAFRLPEFELGVHFGTRAQSNMFATRTKTGRTYMLYASVQNPLRLRDFLTWEATDIAMQLSSLGVITQDSVNKLNERLFKHRLVIDKIDEKLQEIYEERYALKMNEARTPAEQARLDQLEAEHDRLMKSGEPAGQQIEELKRRAIKLFRKRLNEAGYDGVVYANVYEPEYDPVLDETVNRDSYIIWNPAQLKSATGNRGTWSMSDPDILHGVGFGGLRNR